MKPFFFSLLVSVSLIVCTLFPVWLPVCVLPGLIYTHSKWPLSLSIVGFMGVGAILDHLNSSLPFGLHIAVYTCAGLLTFPLCKKLQKQALSLAVLGFAILLIPQLLYPLLLAQSFNLSSSFFQYVLVYPLQGAFYVYALISFVRKMDEYTRRQKSTKRNYRRA